MKKSEFKKIIKPIVLECIRESLFEEGVLAGVISEVVQGMSAQPLLEKKEPPPSPPSAQKREVDTQKLVSSKKKMLAAIGKDAYNGVDLFEGTTPAPAPRQDQGASHGALKDLDPHDSGVDISTLFNNNWSKLV